MEECAFIGAKGDACLSCDSTEAFDILLSELICSFLTVVCPDVGMVILPPSSDMGPLRGLLTPSRVVGREGSRICFDFPCFFESFGDAYEDRIT